jgi:cytochrome c oxidase cbb3-type subunit II
MNNGFILFLGILAAMATSWCGLIFGSQVQLGNLQYTETLEPKRIYPVARLGLAEQGLQVYRANGCYYCHTQQVRPAGMGGDIERGWGLRRTVARDFLLDQPAMIGFSRIGPDLKNVGDRIPDRQWHMVNLFDPQTTVERSVMPPFPFLFEERRIQGEPSPSALQLTGRFAPKPGYEVVPTPEARALVAYMLSLRANVPIFEAPYEFEQEEAPDADAPEEEQPPADAQEF